MISSWLKPVKLKDVLPIVNGLFEHISDNDYVFKCDVTKAQLDYLLLANYAHKTTSPAVDLIHDENDVREQLTDEQMTTLAYMMLNYYKPKWDKLGEIYDVEYDPIHNYLDEWEDTMSQETEGSSEQDATHTDTINTTVTSTHTRTDNLEEETSFGKVTEREFSNDDKTEYDSTFEHEIDANSPLKEKMDYHSASSHEIDSSNPMMKETAYGKTDTRNDDLTKTNSGENYDINSGSDTNAVWGFNSGANPVNSDRTTAGTTTKHRIGDDQGENPLVETNTGTQTHTLSGTDTETNTGKYDDSKSGYDEKTNTGKYKDTKDGFDTVKHTGTITDTDDGSETVANTGTQTNAGSDATTGTNRRVIDDTRQSAESTDRNRSGRHFGNIGNLTSQKMLKEEIELWKWNYVQSILEDARDFLTIPVYM